MASGRARHRGCGSSIARRDAARARMGCAGLRRIDAGRASLAGCIGLRGGARRLARCARYRTLRAGRAFARRDLRRRVRGGACVARSRACCWCRRRADMARHRLKCARPKRDARLAMLAELGPQGLAEQRSANMLSAHASDAARDWVRWNMARIVPQGYAQATHLLANADLAADLETLSRTHRGGGRRRRRNHHAGSVRAHRASGGREPAGDPERGPRGLHRITRRLHDADRRVLQDRR